MSKNPNFIFLATVHTLDGSHVSTYYMSPSNWTLELPAGFSVPKTGVPLMLAFEEEREVLVLHKEGDPTDTWFVPTGRTAIFSEDEAA